MELGDKKKTLKIETKMEIEKLMEVKKKNVRKYLGKQKNRDI